MTPIAARLRPPRSYPSKKAPPPFEPVALPNLGRNEVWAANNLPVVRVAQIIVSKTAAQLDGCTRGMLDTDGLAEETIANLGRVKGHLSALIEVIDAATNRLLLTMASIDPTTRS